MRDGMIKRAETFARRWRAFKAENSATAESIATALLALREQAESERDYAPLKKMLASHEAELGLEPWTERCFHLWFHSIAFHLIEEAERNGAAAHP